MKLSIYEITSNPTISAFERIFDNPNTFAVSMCHGHAVSRHDDLSGEQTIAEHTGMHSRSDKTKTPPRTNT